MPAGTPQKIATAPQLVKTITMLSKNEIETKFPKMGIWALSRISNGQVADLDVVSIGQTEITSLFAKNGKSYPILKIKENLNEQFSGPYVFVGPFGTADGALNFSKANPNHAINAVAAKSVSVMPLPKTAPEPKQKISDKTAAQLQKEVLKNLKEKMPEIQSEQAKTLKQIDSLISAASDNKKRQALILLRKSFSAEVDAFSCNITALTSAINAYVAANPNAPVDDVINGKTLPQIIEQCAECSLGAQEFISKLIKMG